VCALKAFDKLKFVEPRAARFLRIERAVSVGKAGQKHKGAKELLTRFAPLFFVQCV
jgi:hypothetical protein